MKKLFSESHLKDIRWALCVAVVFLGIFALFCCYSDLSLAAFIRGRFLYHIF